MRVPGEIGQHRFRSCEGLLGVDDPVDLLERSQVFGEPGGILEECLIAEELQLAVVVSLSQGFKEAIAEPGAENFDRQEEVRPRGNPAFAIHAEPAAGDDAMDMGMVDEGGTPSVQHRRDADLGTQLLGISRDREQGLRCDLE